MSKPTEDDIQRYHDMLVAIVTREIDLSTPATNKAEMEIGINDMRRYLHVLCWVLGHEHNNTFQKRMELTEQVMKDLGIVETKAPFPMRGPRPREG